VAQYITSAFIPASERQKQILSFQGKVQRDHAGVIAVEQAPPELSHQALKKQEIDVIIV
jgi:hypothetical protein